MRKPEEARGNPRKPEGIRENPREPEGTRGNPRKPLLPIASFVADMSEVRVSLNDLHRRFGPRALGRYHC